MGRKIDVEMLGERRRVADKAGVDADSAALSQSAAAPRAHPIPLRYEDREMRYQAPALLGRNLRLEPGQLAVPPQVKETQ